MEKVDHRVNEAFVEMFGSARVISEAPLAPLTTFRAGGSADWLIEAHDDEEIVRVLGVSAGLGVEVTVLGGGSNVLIGEQGVRGLILRIRHGDIELVQPGVVRVQGGVTLNGLVRWTVNRGWAGLERWAGTPGTVGGGLHGNAHFQGGLLGEHVIRICAVDRQGVERVISGEEMEFSYDASRLQGTREVVLWAEFSVSEFEPALLRAKARESLAYRKRTQPLAVPSAGCVFRNPHQVESLPEGVPCSAGALIDRAGLKGRSVGHATVSQVHGNFIVSDGHAKPTDVRQLIELCRAEVERKFGVLLQDEIIYLGEFDT